MRATGYTLTVKQVEQLADAHIDRYQGMLDCGHPSVNVAECRAYLTIWLSIKGKNMTAKPDYTQQELDEVEAACMSGDYEEIVPIGESVREIQMP